MKYISVPVFVHYHFNANHQLIEAGFSYNYLLNANSKVETDKHSTGSAFTTSSEKKQGYVNGFEKSDIALILGYRHPLTKNLNAVIRLNYGLKDVTKNVYYTNLSKDKIVGVNLLLSYQLK